MLVSFSRSALKSGKAERLYQSEGQPNNLFIEDFCRKQGLQKYSFILLVAA